MAKARASAHSLCDARIALGLSRWISKSAKISGDVMGNYHPHGDAAIYDAMARLAQDFNVAIHWLTAKETLATSTATTPQPADTPRPA